MTVSAVRAELVAKLKTIDPLSGRSYGYAPDSLQVPAAFVGVVTYNPRATFDEPSMTAQVWVATSAAASVARGVDALDDYMPDETNDVAAALEGASAAWDSLAVTSIELPQTIDLGAGQYIAARFDCELYL